MSILHLARNQPGRLSVAFFTKKKGPLAGTRRLNITMSHQDALRIVVDEDAQQELIREIEKEVMREESADE